MFIVLTVKCGFLFLIKSVTEDSHLSPPTGVKMQPAERGIENHFPALKIYYIKGLMAHIGLPDYSRYG